MEGPSTRAACFRAGVRHYDGKVVPDKDPAGRPIFWFIVTPLEGAAEGTDRWAVEHGWVSITPLRLDLTDEADLARALALSDTPAAKVSRKRRPPRSSSKSKFKSSSRALKERKGKRKTPVAATNL